MRLHLRPGQKGTKHLLEQYGDRMVCVRYRYDADRKKRLKTVELIVSERAWEPPRPSIVADQIVELRIAFADAGTRAQVKQAGGRWNPEHRVWRLRYDRVVALGLTARMVDPPASSTGCSRPHHAHPQPDARPVSSWRCLPPELDASIPSEMAAMQQNYGSADALKGH